jgi:hypothetical protein
MMVPKTKFEKRFFTGCALALVVIAAALVLGGVWALLNWYAAPEFAGGILTSERTHFYPGGNPTLRRDTSYVSSAPFGEVYQWYSTTFDLGPETHGQGLCILMARSRDRLRVLREDVSVTVCDTPTGRMIVMSRYLTLRVR